MVDQKVHEIILASVQKPVVGEAGKTGSWSRFKPKIDLDKCSVVKMNKDVCHFCWIFCPDGVISRTIPPKINYEYCKGCGICAEVCPPKAIKMVEESEL